MTVTSFNRTHSFLSSLHCAQCNTEYDAHSIQKFAGCCNQPLVAKYDPEAYFSTNQLKERVNSMWRYHEMLPVNNPNNIISLGEGMTPLFPLNRLARKSGIAQLLIKDESANPTGSFKARGISAAVSKAKELGIQQCIVPTAGNAGGALAAYCAHAGMACTVVMPTHTPEIFKQECELYHASVITVNGLINDCAARVQELNRGQDYFDFSTLKEPYRLEGKKTMGYEIAEQMNWMLPDVIIYPAGGGTGLIGIWKAFQEMITMGWINGPLPKMIAVQSSQCAPIIHALQNPASWKNQFIPKPTIANGLAVPYPFGMDMMLDVLHQSGGTAVAVDDSAIIEAVRSIASEEGLLVSPEGAATWVALKQLLNRQIISASQSVLLLNTGSGYKYMDNIYPR